MKINFLVLIASLYLFSCSRAPYKNKEDLTRKTSKSIKIIDSLPRESFFQTLKSHLEVMKKSRVVQSQMDFGSIKVDKNLYIKKLEELLAIENNSEVHYVDYLNEHFDLYEVYGNENWGDVMITGYYEPWVPGSKKPNELHHRPLYKTPKDLITVNLKSFNHKFSSTEKLGLLQGRLDNQSLVAYYSRDEIDVGKKLKNQELEIVYVDPVDAFFIQIQGSGVVVLEDGTAIRIGYANQNGHSYVPIGRHLRDVIPMEEMSMQRIRQHLKTLTLAEQQRILNLNPSYVFFQYLDSESLTFAGMEVSDGRTIATDQFLFPKGALAFLEVDEPLFESALDITAKEMRPLPRVVFDQDTGGAIRGPGRVDLYIGKGDVAAQKAGVMKNPGKLYYLVPKNLF